MLAESITFLATFITTSGLAAIGILISYQMFQTDKNIIYQDLLYQQIFLFSFFFYSIWGNLAIRTIVSEVTTNNELMARLTFFLPLPGLPFLMVSWFMLIKYGFNLCGRKVRKSMIYSYYSGSVLILALAAWLFSTGIINVPAFPDVFLFKLFTSINLFMHIIFLLPFLKPWKLFPVYIEKERWKRVLWIYLAGTIVYSATLFFTGSAGYFMIAGSILLMFTVSIGLPIGLKYANREAVNNASQASGKFEAFCKKYQISKREAEIILEICAGKSNKAIADKLFISLQTVKDHNHRIFTKTQVKSRVQLANLVREMTGKLSRPVYS